MEQNQDQKTQNKATNQPYFDIPKAHCLRCQHTWLPRKSVITICAKCKSPYWSKEKEDSNVKLWKGRVSKLRCAGCNSEMRGKDKGYLCNPCADTHPQRDEIMNKLESIFSEVKNG